jgi:TonB family protein
MHLTLLESERSFLQTTECALVSLVAHGTLVVLAVSLAAGGRQLPADEREARVFFLLPPDRVDMQPYQTETFQWGRLGVDLEDGMHLTSPAPGRRARPQAWSARGRREGSGARGAVPFGPVSKLAFDTVFSVLEVDRTVERYDGSAAPAYPPELAALGVEGLVRVGYVVDTTGLADRTSIRVLYSDDPGFTASVLTALGLMRFRPATREGKEVRQQVEQQFRFQLMPGMKVPGSAAS